MTELAPPPPHNNDLIEVVFDVRTVSLLIRPPQGNEPAASTEDAVEALRRSPFAAIAHQQVAQIVAAQSTKPVPVGSVPVPAGVTGWFLVTSPDALAAYLVPAPPPKIEALPVEDDASPAESGPPPVEGAPPSVEDQPSPAVSDDHELEPSVPLLSSTKIVKLLKEHDVKRGVLSSVVDSFDPARPLETIECVALAQPPVQGRDAIVEVLVTDQEDHHPVTRADGSVDHHANVASRFVEAGTVLATRIPPDPGAPGVDVSGQPIEPRAVVDHQLERLAGQNTAIEGDQLLAVEPGRPMLNGERIDLLHSYEVPGDLNYAVGNIVFDGDVTVRGDVKPGFSIVATGSVTIGGVLEHASIEAGHDISVQGVIGEYHADGWMEEAEHTTTLQAGGDVHAQYLRAVTVRAGGEVRVNREIVNSNVQAARVEMGAGGRIVQSDLVVESDIEAGALGSHNGAHTHLHVTTHRSEEPLVIRAWDTAHAGVHLNISGAVLKLEDDVASPSFWQLEGEIAHLDARATLRDIVAFAEETGRRPPNAPPGDGDAVDADAEARTAA